MPDAVWLRGICHIMWYIDERQALSPKHTLPCTHHDPKNLSLVAGIERLLRMQASMIPSCRSFVSASATDTLCLSSMSIRKQLQVKKDNRQRLYQGKLHVHVYLFSF